MRIGPVVLRRWAALSALLPMWGLALEEQPAVLEPELVVTASRSAREPGEVMAFISVITLEDIRRSLAEDLLELLRLQPGIDIVRTGGPGGQTSVFMRGTNSNHALVLIDGVRVASNNTGGYAWEQLPINQIDRIEIIRGPRASLYGSDAIGGIIRIFTRQSATPELRLTAGSFSSGEVEAAWGYETARSGLSIGGGYRDVGGFSAQNDGGFSYHPDDDGLRAANLSLNGAREFGEGTLAYRALATRNRTDFDQGRSRGEQYIASLAWSATARPGWNYQLQAGYVDDSLESDFGFFTTGFDSRRLDLQWQNQLELRAGQLGFGVDHVDDTGRAQGSYAGDRRNTGAYLLLEQPYRRSRLQLSGRFDRNSEFGIEFTYQAALALDVGAQGKLMGLYGTAFRAPNLNELLSPGFDGLFAGNPDLQPETARSLELLYQQPLGGGSRIVVSAWHTEVDGLIAFAGERFRAVNIDRAELRGVELDLQAARGPWRFKASVTWQESRDRSSRQALLRRPEEKAAFSVDRRLGGRAWLGADWFVSGPRDDIGGQRLPGYGIFSLRGGLDLTHRLALEIRLDNAFDRDYEPVIGFNSAGRAGFVSLRWEPGGEPR
ncbi:MAG: TonB-dependent receptor [Xanthomonadales bacterium]|nr:TonB-dependent receptor [Xanthomonadales bacterium]NIN58752.1 TonB-dependent receptor [Xanthomonadales bacterium]NIN74018.1 TonB-dependent receptor [Xanthomonadales bacterium]NIO12933.1 TonB-dependent receptor [Xanthomonadales bacterium]NIP11145.1 TonB-dependent receptor [Xanthomonadales bacterium]